MTDLRDDARDAFAWLSLTDDLSALGVPDPDIMTYDQWRALRACGGESRCSSR